MSEPMEELLEPISADQPCGPDLTYDPRFEDLLTKLNGKPEVEIGNFKKPAEPPDWRELRTQCRDFLTHSKHLRVAVIYCCSLLKTDGLAGFCSGLLLVRGLLERYWASVYPLLDPEDNQDPTQRLNILLALTIPRGKVTGWLTFIDYLYASPIFQAKGAPAFTFDHLKAAKLRGPDLKEPDVSIGTPQFSKIEAAIRGPARDQAAANYDLLRQALDCVEAIDQFLTTTLGAGVTISFDVLRETLEEMLAMLNPYLQGATERGLTAPGSPNSEDQSTPTAGTMTISGSIRSRQDVSRAIDSICEYFRQVEPSSPVPYLLRRAQKLAGMNFVQAVQELSLATVDTLRPSMGSALDATPVPGESSTSSNS